MDRKKAQLETPKHKFTDANYDQQKSQVLDNLDDALEAGLKKTKKSKEKAEESKPRKNGAGSGTSVTQAALKRKSEEEEEGASATKKLFGMGEMDELDDSGSSSSSTEESEEEVESVEEGEAERKDYCKSGEATKSESAEGKGAAVISSFEENSQSGVDQRENSPLQGSLESSENVVVGENSSEPPEVPETTTAEDVQNGGTPEAMDRPQPPSDATPPPPPSLPLDLTGYSSTDDLAALGLDTLKAALTAIGLKCGGTLEERAARLWSVRGIDEAEWDKSLLAKGKGKGKGKN